jgi:hypothetical protein
MAEYESLKFTSYTRLPPSLEKAHAQWASLQKYDKYGARERLEAIKFALGERNLGLTIDLGGNSGYFCLSLIDEGKISKATVYDVSQPALKAGRMMAELMGINHKIDFIEQAIDREFVRNLPHVDTIFCLNLLHHAGAEFDVERVQQEGWEKYAADFLRCLREKAGRLVVGMKFEVNRPRFWDVPHQERARRFADIADQSGWRLLYEANVRDIEKMGVARANGLYTKGGHELKTKRRPFSIFLRKLSRWANLKSLHEALNNRRHKYHLFIFES